VHNSRCHIAEECQEIKKLVEQPHHDGTPPYQREGKQHVAHTSNDEEEMEFQNAKRAIKVIYDHSD
jgi:hypothetical protein